MLTSTQLASWDRDGFLVLPEAVDMLRCWELMERAAEIVADFDPSTVSVFSTNEQTRTSDEYFLASGDRISCFFEEGAVDDQGRVTGDVATSINKIGHVIDGSARYPSDNWLQRPNLPLRGFDHG